MIKEIRYGGCSTVPSDYESPDGDLTTSINMVPEENGLQPVLPPAKVASFIVDNIRYRVILVHKVPDRVHYILQGEVTPALYWINKADIPGSGLLTSSLLHLLTTIEDIKDITIIGNSIVVAEASGMRYFLWNHDKYMSFGSKPPFVTIEFGLERYLPFGGRSKIHIPQDADEDSVLSDSNVEIIKNHVYGLLLSNGAGATKRGAFWQPFMIRYAYRLYDGGYMWHSSPVLMLPVVHPPVIGATGSIRHLPADITSDVGFNLSFLLDYRIRQFNKTELEKWKDLIKGIDIFVTPPIYTFDQNSDNISTRRGFAGAYTPIGDDGEQISLGRPGVGNSDSTESRANGGSSESGIEYTSHFDGHYKDRGSNEYKDVLVSIPATGIHSAYPEGENKAQSYEWSWVIPVNEKFGKEVRDAANFYKIASLELEELSSTTNFRPLKVESLENLETQERLPDELDTHASFTGECLFSFNNRLSVGNIKLTPAAPLPINSMVQFNGSYSATSTDSVRLTVWSRRNGVRFQTLSTTANVIDLDNVFPRYLYHPDHDAYKIKIENLTTGKSWILPLKPHDFLNGAYYYNPKLTLSALPSETVSEEESALLSPIITLANRVYTSDVDNPFSFPATNRISVGQGTVLGLSTAAKALSQGQFGQFPLYAFTSEGVWALEISDSGAYVARQPITRDVCVNTESLTQIDSAVLFAASRGIMLLSGSSSVCISESLNIDSSITLLDMPYSQEIIEKSGLPDECFNHLPFDEYIKGCRMIYDYVRQRILVYNPNLCYGYVYSLRTKKWGMTENTIVSNVNSYPEALAMDKDGYLLNCSSSDAEMAKGLVMTRPFKLDSPDILKTVNTVIQRGYFRKGNVCGVLLGSRNMFDWFMISSSSDHYLRGFRGTPYKYFRMVLPCSLREDESLVGCTVQYTPRMTNQPR